MWTKEFPTEEGYYWFYGTYLRTNKPVVELEIVQKWGKFLVYKRQMTSVTDLDGVFLRIEEPELPKNF